MCMHLCLYMCAHTWHTQIWYDPVIIGTKTSIHWPIWPLIWQDSVSRDYSSVVPLSLLKVAQEFVVSFQKLPKFSRPTLPPSPKSVSRVALTCLLLLFSCLPSAASPSPLMLKSSWDHTGPVLTIQSSCNHTKPVLTIQSSWDHTGPVLTIQSSCSVLM